MVVKTAPIETSNTRYTGAQFFDLSRFFDPAYHYELRDGIIYKMPPSSMVPSKIALRIALYIGNYLLENDIGHLTGADGAYELNDENTLVPDVGFISYERQPEDTESGFVPQAPDFAIEVLSLYDSKEQTQQKAQTYLSSGTRLVWIVYPATDTVEVCRYDAEGQLDITTMGPDDILTAEDVLPGFTLPVNDIFAVKRTD